MAITPSQWSHVLTIPESYTPSAATSGQTLVITESVIAKLSAGDQTTFWSNVANGGGDVRICTDSAGTNQLPVEIVSLDNIAETCVIWTRKATYAGTGDLYVFIGKAGETQPVVTDPFGINAVWADYLFVHHLNDASSLINAQGSADWNVDSVTGVLTTSSESPFNHSSVNFDGSSFARIVNNVGIADASTEPRTVQVWARPANLPNDEMGILVRDVSSNGGFKFYFDNSETVSGNSDTFILNSDSTSDRVTTTGNNSAVANAWQMIHVANQRDVVQNTYYNGALAGTANGTPMSTFQGDDQLIGGTSGYISSGWQGQLAELRIAKAVLSTDYIATEYANQSAPATFYGTPTIATTGGGGAVTADVTEVSTDAVESSSISISANITAQVTELSSSATESSAAAFTTTVSVSVTELSDDASESSTVTITNQLVTANVTELSADFSESATASFSGSLSAIVTELAQSAAESSSVDISANISVAVTELAQDFADNANVNLVGNFTVEVTETTTDFDEACYVQLPVQRLTPRKTISVNARRSGRISVNAKRSQTIKVR